MERGADVLSEKPFALSVAEAQTAVDAQKIYGKRLMVAHVIRFWPEYEYLRECIQNEPYGKLLGLSFLRVSGRRDAGLAFDNWPDREDISGSCVLDQSIHDIDFMRSVLGEPDEVNAHIYYHHGNPEHMYSLFRFGKIPVAIESGWDYPRGGIFPFTMAYRAMFELGGLVYDGRAKPTMTFYTETEGVVYPNEDARGVTDNGQVAQVPEGDGYLREIDYFLHCLETGAPFALCPPEDTLKTMALAERLIVIGKRATRA